MTNTHKTLARYKTKPVEYGNSSLPKQENAFWFSTDIRDWQGTEQRDAATKDRKTKKAAEKEKVARGTRGNVAEVKKQRHGTSTAC